RALLVECPVQDLGKVIRVFAECRRNTAEYIWTIIAAGARGFYVLDGRVRATRLLREPSLRPPEQVPAGLDGVRERPPVLRHEYPPQSAMAHVGQCGHRREPWYGGPVMGRPSKATAS